jgi:hypothetical protein
MRMKKEQFGNAFTSLDAYLAGFLTLKGFSPQLINQSEKVVFSFHSSKELYKAITEYNSGAIVEASKYTFVIKTLKSQIHSMRKNDK